MSLSREEQGVIWDYYKPRHTHAWNMLVLSWRQLEHLNEETDIGFETEYHWENYILRLWLYRTTIKTLAKLHMLHDTTNIAIAEFDAVFTTNEQNHLKALRDMIEHFDDYAAGAGRGPAQRESDLDPWRTFNRDSYERGQFCLERQSSYSAAINLRSEAKQLSSNFIQWYKAV